MQTALSRGWRASLRRTWQSKNLVEEELGLESDPLRAVLAEFDLVEGALLSDLAVRHSHQAAPSRNYWE